MAKATQDEWLYAAELVNDGASFAQAIGQASKPFGDEKYTASLTEVGEHHDQCLRHCTANGAENRSISVMEPLWVFPSFAHMCKALAGMYLEDPTMLDELSCLPDRLNTGDVPVSHITEWERHCFDFIVECHDAP